MYSISFQDDISMMPRERLMREGAEKLSNQELLSIFLRTGNKKETVFQVSNFAGIADYFWNRSD